MKFAAQLRLLGSLMLLSVLFFACEQMPATPVSHAKVPDNPATNIVATTSEENGTSTSDSLITFYAGLNNPYFLPGVENENYLYLEAKAAKYVPPATAQRAPLNISLVIDRSGSMQGDKIAYVKRAAEFVVNNLNSEDILSIVTYDDAIETLVPSGRLENKTAVKEKIATITSRGSTNLCGGMLKGYDQVKSTYKKGYVNRVLLLTDGLANEGITDPQQIMQIARKKNLEDGISISTFGVGADFNENLLTGIAEYGSGNYYFINSPDEIPQIFEKELKGLLAVVAQNMKLTITLTQTAKLVRVFGYQYEQQGNTVTISFRDVYSEETKAVLMKISIPASEKTAVAMNAKLEYDDATDKLTHKALESNNVITAMADKATLEKSYSARIVQQVTLFESNDKLEQAMKAVDEGRYEEARKLVGDNDFYLNEQSKVVQFNEELIKQKDNNTLYQQKIKNVESMNEYDKKVMQKGEKSFNYEIRKKK